MFSKRTLRTPGGSPAVWNRAHRIPYPVPSPWRSRHQGGQHARSHGTAPGSGLDASASSALGPRDGNRRRLSHFPVAPRRPPRAGPGAGAVASSAMPPLNGVGQVAAGVSHDGMHPRCDLVCFIRTLRTHRPGGPPRAASTQPGAALGHDVTPAFMVGEIQPANLLISLKQERIDRAVFLETKHVTRRAQSICQGLPSSTTCRGGTPCRFIQAKHPSGHS